MNLLILLCGMDVRMQRDWDEIWIEKKSRTTTINSGKTF